MIKGFVSKKEKRDQLLVIFVAIMSIIFVVWLLTPPTNKIAQIGSLCNDIIYSLTKSTRTQYQEVWYHRNQGVYYARMNKEKAALMQLNKAISLGSGFMSEAEIQELYKARATVKLYFKDYKGALNDYTKSGTPSLMENLILAQLYKKDGKRKIAYSYCNNIIVLDEKAYSGFACLADLYADAGRYSAAVKVYDIYLDRTVNKAKGLADRSYYKSKLGDFTGAAADMKAAKDLSPNVKKEITILKEALNPKSIDLPII